MVYYSPFKQFIRALIRSVRVFISSLFSKRLLFMIIVALVIMLLHLNVHAASDFEDGYAYRYVTEPEYDSTTDSYHYSYRTFTAQGVKEGEFYLPSSMYNNNIWIVSVGDDGTLYYWHKSSTNSSETLYLSKSYPVTSDRRFCPSFISPSSQRLICDRYTYDFETDTWGTATSLNTENFHVFNNNTNYSASTISPLGPNNILIAKNCSIQGHDRNVSGNMASYLVMRDTRRLKTPTLYYYPDTGFRLYLNDFIPYDSNDYQDLNLGYSTVDTVSMYFAIYDMENHQYILNLTPLQLQDIDDDGNYYIDLPFYDGTTLASNLRYMVDNGGDYLMLFGTTLTNNKCVNGMSPSTFTITTLYDSLDYFRFIYYKNSNAGILTSVYEDGTENPNKNNNNGGDNSGETNTTDNQTANVINDLNNTISNQTTIIQEQTNTINDMSNFMQDDSYSSNTITNNMPNSNEYNDITENGFDNIFTTLRNTFTSSNYQDVVFTVPFSNGQTITLPSNLTENIVPTAIKNLIQLVYWFLISRFIVKDIAKYIENAKSGDIFSSSDTNIKTDML